MLASRPIPIYRLAGLAIAASQLLCVPSSAQPKAPTQPAGQPATKAQAAANYGRIPLSFEANRGQTDPSVQFLSHGRGYTLFLRQGEAVLALRGGKPAGPIPATSAGSLGIENAPSSDFESSVVRLQLAGANPHASVREEDRQITRTNYFIGKDPAKWRTDIPNYSRVRYADVYPGIDLVYYGNQSRLEHDFVVAPGADPARIQLALDGAERVRIDRDTGDLVLSTDSGELRLLKPVTYQESNGKRMPVPSSYKLLAGNRIAFTLGRYNQARPLVIDPVLVYSTYLGGSGNSKGKGDQGNGIAVDSSGDAYIVGTTYSVNFPVAGGTYQSLNYAAVASSSGTVFVTELNSAGTALVYSTYFGGSDSDFGYAIALDSSNNAYIAGATYSADFPATCGAFQTSNPSDSAATTGFVAKLNSSGGLVYSTYLGGGNDVAQAIAVDSSGDAYVAGYTLSASFPTTDGAFQTTYTGDSNAFVAKLNPGGTGLVYSTLLSGSESNSGNVYANAIAIDTSGDAFVTGSTASSTFPVTTGALQTSSLGSPTAFVTEFNPTGTDEVYSTFLGGSGGDSAQAIVVDGNGFAYVAGNTSSGDFPLTDGVLEPASTPIPTYVGQYGHFTFVAKLNQPGTTLEYSTYVEGQGTLVTGLAVDGSGDAYLTGTAPTASVGAAAGFQLTPDALPVPASQGNSAFLVKLDPAAEVLNYATLLGGSKNDGAMALALDASGNVYLAGYAGSTNFPTTSGALQTENTAASVGASNAFIAKFALAAETNQTAYPVPPSQIATSISNVNAQYVGSGEYGWVLFVGFNLNSETPGPPATGSFTTYVPPPTLACDTSCVFSLGPFGIGGSWTGSSSNGLPGDGWLAPGPNALEIAYSGDAIYQPSSILPNYTVDCLDPGYCFGDSIHRPSSIIPDFTVLCPDSGYCNEETKRASTEGSPESIPHKVEISGPKFTPPPANPRKEGHESSRRPSPKDQGDSACLVTYSVTVSLYNSSRLYGATNPGFGYEIKGLPSGDALAVIPYTTATQSSPVGSYPISASLSGPPYDLLTVIGATLQVTKAPLAVVPQDAYQLTGIAPGPFSYELTGFLNGDTASVVSGAPVLTTKATASSPTGTYGIFGSQGTLTAANYNFVFQRGFLNIFAPIDAGPAAVGGTVSRQFEFANGPVNSIGSAAALTDGAIKPEFSGASISKNAGAYTASFDFIPHAPGLWTGAFQILSNSTPPQTIISIPVYGRGSGPQSVFDPGLEVAVRPSGTLDFSSPQGVAVDENGTLYVADAGKDRIDTVIGNRVNSFSLGGTELKSPSGVAVDGAGNLYIADSGNNRIVQLTLSDEIIVMAPPGITLSGPRGLAVDGSGDLLIADTGDDRIVEISAAGVASVVSTGTLKLSSPSGLAVDAAGDLFIADTGHNRIVKIASTGAASVVSTGTPALSGPTGITVDPAGTLYITEAETGKLVEVSPGGVQTELLASGLSSPHGIALDHSGVLYIADTGNHRVLELERNASSTVKFAKTTVGKEDAGGPQTVTVRNIGNTVLTIGDVTFPADFPEDASGKSKDCKAGKALAAAASCTLTIDFKPVTPVKKGTSAALKEAVKVTTDSLNNSGAVQKVAVEGTELK